MKLPRVFFRKVLLGIVLIALAAGITVFIKEALDTQDPESALPLITVEYNNAPLPPAAVKRAGWEWSFFLTLEKAPLISPEDAALTPVDVVPDQTIRVLFSQDPSTLKISRAEGLYSQDYLEITGDTPGQFSTPKLPGLYVYKIEASWGNRGNIQYYFAVQVK